MAWILICGIAVFLSSEAALVLGKSPLASHPLWGRVLWGLITLPTVGLILYGLGIRPIYLMVRKASNGATWVDALGSHCLELGVFLFFMVPANLWGPGMTYWPGLAGTAIFKFFHYCGVSNERQLERLVQRHAPYLRYGPQVPSLSGQERPEGNSYPGPEQTRWTFEQKGSDQWKNR